VMAPFKHLDQPPEGQPERRTGASRRHADQVPPDGVLVWSARRLFATLGLVVGVATATLGLAATLGLRWGPREDLKTIQAAIQLNNARIDTLAAQLRNVEAEVRGIRIQEYLTCTRQPKADPTACETFIK
jgi:hypothetical protein